MKYISFAAGIGGFDLGFDMAGMQCAAQVEIDSLCRAVLRAHWPGVPHLEDMRDVQPEQLPTVDLFTAGLPCQDYSTAGKRAGLAGKRGGLWFEFLRILRGTLPRWVVIENVPGLLSSRGGRDFARILCGLGQCGYLCSWRVLNSEYFGVPQRRRRLFLIGHLRDGRAAEVFFKPDRGAWDFEAGQTPGAEVAYPLAAGAGGSKHGSGRSNQDTLVTFKRRGGYGYSEFEGVTGTLEAQGNGTGGADKVPMVNNLTWRDGACPDDNSAQGGKLVCGTLSASGAGTARTGNGNEDSFLVPMTFNHQSGGDLRLNIATDKANPLQAHQTQAVMGAGVRRLTPVECERLQGFPDGWTEYGDFGRDIKRIADTNRYRMLGNAVTVPVAAWIAGGIIEADKFS